MYIEAYTGMALGCSASVACIILPCRDSGHRDLDTVSQYIFQEETWYRSELQTRVLSWCNPVGIQALHEVLVESQS